MSILTLPAVWMRGGTSKGLFFRRQDLPEDRGRWDELFLAAMGSPDPFGNQLDGLGGATPATSKVAVVGPSGREDCDVDCYIGHVSISEAVVESTGECANLCAAVGPFAIHAGLAPAEGESATVRIWQENLGRRVEVIVPLDNGHVQEAGHCHIDGVRGSGAEIQVEFPRPGGGEAGAVLPSGEVIDELQGTGGRHYPVSLLDAGRPTVFVLARQLGLQGSESREDLAARPQVLRELASLGTAAAAHIQRDDVQPDIVLIARPQDYPTPKGNWIWAEGIHLNARLIRRGMPHPGIGDSAALALAVAARIPDSLVQQLVRAKGSTLAFGHASGLMRVSARVREGDAGWVAESAAIQRTARRLMAGRVYLQEGLEDGPN